jgi:hypothetical protein
MRSTQWVDARKKPETYCGRLRMSDATDARWLQAAPEHLGVTQYEILWRGVGRLGPKAVIQL